MESTYDMVARIQEKYPVVSGEVVEDIAKSVLQDAISRQDAAQIALLISRKMEMEYQSLTAVDQFVRFGVVLAAIDAQKQAIVNALMTEKLAK